MPTFNPKPNPVERALLNLALSLEQSHVSPQFAAFAHAYLEGRLTADVWKQIEDLLNNAPTPAPAPSP